ncbi:MAG: beta strand repeat-containing protein [Isosphaeraceae bacterium]
MKRRISRRFQPTMTLGLDQLESRQLLSSGFQVVPSPAVTGSTLSAVSAVSPTDIWAVGSDSTGPLIENFNGTSWSVVPAPAVKGGTLSGVTALSSNAVWAVGSTLSSTGVFTPLVEFFNGTSWSVQTTPTLPKNGNSNDTAGGGEFKAVTAISPTDVWAVGGLGNGRGGNLIENFNGTSWNVVQAPGSDGSISASLSAISAVSSTDIWAVGSVPKGNQLLQFNGTAWSTPSSQIVGSAATKAVDAISATDVWVTGGAGIWNFNGTSWSQVAFPNADLVAISGSSADNIVAVGSGLSSTNGLVTGFGTVAEQWNGTSWSAVTTVNPGTNQDGLTGVATLSNGTVVAVGNASPGGGIIESATLSVSPPTAIATTTALTFTPNSASFGTSVTFTATITPASIGSAAPTGTVAFFSGSTLLGGGTVSNDVATFTTNALPVGSSSITAEYVGDANYAASTSPADSVTTTQSTTTTAISFSPALPVLGQNVTLTATITPETTGPASPTGTVEFLDGSTVLGSATVSSDVATLITTALPLGTSSITATYEGDTNYAGSTSAADSVTVVQSATPPSAPFQIVTSPTVTGATLSAVSAVSPTDIFAVGSQSTSTGDVGPLTEIFNGTSWSVVAAPTPAGSSGAEFSSVSAVASNNVWAVGSSFTVNSSGVTVSTPLIEHYNGTSWSIQTNPATAGTLNAVTAISPTDVWAVGGTGSADLIENFNGTSWSIVQAPSPPTAHPSLSGISAVSPTDIFAIGGNGKGNFPQILQFNGTTWTSLANLPTGIAVTAIDAISATDVWTVGGGSIWNFNGTSWTEVASGLGGDLFAISGSSANDIYAVGETISTTDETLVEQWNGTSWSTVTSAGAGELNGVTTLSNGTAVAVGAPGIETNATTAAPASTSASGTSLSGVVPSSTVQLPATSTVRVPVRVISPNITVQLPATSTVRVPIRVILPNGTTAPPQTSPVQVLTGDVLGALSNDTFQPPAAAPTRRR